MTIIPPISGSQISLLKRRRGDREMGRHITVRQKWTTSFNSGSEQSKISVTTISTTAIPDVMQLPQHGKLDTNKPGLTTNITFNEHVP